MYIIVDVIVCIIKWLIQRRFNQSSIIIDECFNTLQPRTCMYSQTPEVWYFMGEKESNILVPLRRNDALFDFQPFANEKPCVACEAHMTKKSGAFWEGGKGCRDKIKMSR